MEQKSAYIKWEHGELTFLGSFQTTIFQAYRLAGTDNQNRLCRAFPYWFLDNPSIDEQSTSKEGKEILQELREKLMSQIQKHLDKNPNLKFSNTVTISYANQEMTRIQKIKRRYLLMTVDNDFGDNNIYELQDQTKVSIEDLVWILEQIEERKKGF